MKAILIIIPILLGFKTIPKKYRGLTKKELAQQIKQLKTHRGKSKMIPPSNNKLFNENLKLQLELNRFKKINSFAPTFDNQYSTIATFERFYGIIDGNIISSGYPVNFKIDFKNTAKIPSGSYLSCTGVNYASKYNYRIMASCDRLITPENEYSVIIGIKDTKKIDGIAPDHIYTGDEEAIIGEGFSALMAGIIDARKERVRTAINFTQTPTLKNAYLNGIINAAKMANQKGKDHSSEQVIVLAVKDKKQVIIEFKRRFNYEKD